eukprot:TRINITY_DN3459_c0_g3_i2.p1 TRINITY_DN3459_c0_g3~~TRINITY_DN3459_c0_g3_i2.p1  ORF type:complete len:607 (-),score=80.43 TRINITY_DN3459_c0_g3_i2:39-1859(-)
MRFLSKFKNTDIQPIIRHKDDLDDYLFELNSPFIQKEAAKNFNYVDIVCIEGESNVLPWDKEAEKMMILVRMCLRTDKLVFASGSAMQFLVFLAATNLERNVHVINGKGRGSKMGQEDVHLSKKLVELQSTDFFLDNVTGDLYNYNYDTDEWIPRANAGIHYRKAAETFNSLGRFVIKVPTYRPKPSFGDSNLYISKNTETICSIKKVYIQHWLVKGVDSEFLVPSNNMWDIHPFNFSNPKKVFYVIGEADRGAQIISFHDIVIACLFQINRKYPHTITVLENFLAMKIEDISIGYKSANVLERMSIGRETSLIEGMHQKKRTKLNDGVVFVEEDAGVEKGSPKNKRVIVKNNTIGKFSFKGITRAEQQYQRNEKNDRNERNEESRSSLKKAFSFYSDHMPQVGDLKENMIKMQKVVKTDGRFPKPILKVPKTDKEPNDFSQSSVRKLLHPQIPPECLDNRALWVPGMLNGSPFSRSRALSRESQTGSISHEFRNGSTHSILKPSTALFRKGYFDEPDQKASILAGTQYKTYEELWKADQREKDKLIIGPKRMKVGRSLDPRYSGASLSTGPYQPISKHKYREDDRKRWISQTDFKNMIKPTALEI